MATLPDIPTLRGGLIEVFSSFHHGRPRPNDGLQWGSIRERWGQLDFRVEDFQRLVASMVNDATLTEANGFYTLTDKAVADGLIQLPTLGEIERAILDFYRERNTRPNEAQMPREIQLALFERGFTGEECVRGFDSLVEKGLLERFNQMLRLAQLGFDQM